MPTPYPVHGAGDGWDTTLKNYVDSALNGETIDTSGRADGDVVTWDAGAGEWTAAPSAGSGGTEPVITTFFAPGADTFTPPVGAVFHRVRLQGGGGAGGGSSIALASEVAKGGGGGGGAGVVIQLPASAVPGPVPVFVGAPGAGVAAADGGNGGDTTWDPAGPTETTAFGGQGGGAMVGVDNTTGNATTAHFLQGTGGGLFSVLLTPPLSFWNGCAGSEGQVINGQVVAASGHGGASSFGGPSDWVFSPGAGAGGHGVLTDSGGGAPATVAGLNGGGGWILVESWF